MTYLLAKYTLLFLMAALAGFLLGRWSIARRFVDITESYKDLRSASELATEQWSRLWRRLDDLPQPAAVDFSKVTDRLDGLAYAIGNIPAPQSPDLSTIENGLSALRDNVQELARAESEIDLGDVERAISGVAVEVHELLLQGSTAPVDLEPVFSRFNGIDEALRNLPPKIEPKETNLISIESRLTSLGDGVQALSRQQLNAQDDRSRLHDEIRAVNQKFTGLPSAPDLAPVQSRLTAIEGELKRLKLQPLPPKAPKPKKNRTATNGKFLESERYGTKDDLRQILGVGPKLQRLLNRNGVYYFWQIASWNTQDIAKIDVKLENFRGRIRRDNWVRQASALARRADTANRPDAL